MKSKWTEIVIVRYPDTGKTIAYRKDDPELIEVLIDVANLDEEIVFMGTLTENQEEEKETKQGDK